MTKWVEEAKNTVARQSLNEVLDGQIIGIGSGSTVAKFIELLSDKIKREKIQVSTVPSSLDSEYLLLKNKIPQVSLVEYSQLDLTIDGADEVNPQLDLIKGGGGCLFREKVIAAASKRLIILVDKRKLVDRLGTQAPLPVAVHPFALGFAQRKLAELGGEAKLRTATRKMGPVLTDDGHLILDTKFRNQEYNKDLEERINSIQGVVENGLFIDMADKVYVGGPKGVKTLTK
jgi:ribose 5-phosphate isomerase A